MPRAFAPNTAFAHGFGTVPGSCLTARTHPQLEALLPGLASVQSSAITALRLLTHRRGPGLSPGSKNRLSQDHRAKALLETGGVFGRLAGPRCWPTEVAAIILLS